MAFPQQNKYPNSKKPLLVTNNRIQSKTVRVTKSGEYDGLHTKEEALRIANDLGVDLIEISLTPSGESICCIMDSGKFLYEKKKKEKENKKATVQSEMHIVRLGPNTSDNDINHKVKQAIDWLLKGDKVKCEILFKGRQIQHQDNGLEVMLKFANGCVSAGVLEAMPSMSGKFMSQIIKPIPKSLKKAS